MAAQHSPEHNLTSPIFHLPPTHPHLHQHQDERPRLPLVGAPRLRVARAVPLKSHWASKWTGKIALLLCLLLLLAGCGPEDEASGGDTTAEAIRIAQEYSTNNDLARARGELDTLDVANPTQFLIYLAETRSGEDPGSAEADALVKLALALGLQSGKLMDYAVANSLLANAPAPTFAQIAEGAQEIAPVASNTPPPATPPATPAAVAAASVSAQPASAVVTSTTGEVAPASEAISETTGRETTGETAPAAELSAPTPTPVSQPVVQSSTAMNVRGGPSTDYAVVGALNAGDQVDIIAKNPQGDWWQVTLTNGTLGWVYGALVQATGDTSAIAVASDIPAAPPTATPAPVAQAPAEQPTVAPAPAEQAPAEQPPAEQPIPASNGSDFSLVEKRLWDVYENGGQLSGPTVICGEKRELRVIVLDANGGRLNGVAVQEIYGAKEIQVTGAQGKGDGQVEFILGRGQGVKIIRDADGREVVSDVAEGMVTEPAGIPYELLIGGKYCTDDASCKSFVDAPGCWGHYSWTVTFKRNY